MAGMKCPKCGSTNFKNCQLIYQSGTRTRSFQSSTGYTSSGTNSTLLAQSVAPPYPKEEHWGSFIILCAIASFFVCNVFFSDKINFFYDIYYKYFYEYFYDYKFKISELGFIVIGSICYSAFATLESSYKASRYNNKVYPKEYEEWQNTYVCMKCGNRFTF